VAVKWPNPTSPVLTSRCTPTFRQVGKDDQGKTYYVGTWDDPEGTLREYFDQKDDLYAGRTPGVKVGATIRELCNAFMRAKRIDMDAGRLSPRSCSFAGRSLPVGNALRGVPPDGNWAEPVPYRTLLARHDTCSLTMTKCVDRCLTRSGRPAALLIPIGCVLTAIMANPLFKLGNDV
jgi:hypothetical protein